MADSGRPTLLTTETLREIRKLVLDGKNLTEIAEILGLSYATLIDWKYENYDGFSDKLLAYKHERIINKAEVNIEESMKSEDERIRVDVSKFALERLNKKEYSTRAEITGKGGDAIEVDILPITSLTNILHGNNESITSEDTGNTGDTTKSTESASV